MADTEDQDAPHSARMEQELRALREMFQRAFEAEDAPRAVTLARIIEQSERNLEKARIREGTYLPEATVLQWGRAFSAKVIEICRRHVTDEQWSKIVDDFIAEGY
jgi:hypothetical protein